ncbi:uncharacterized protein [Nicotiana tomentosiformis]|uniref:uncharacterized protein n=1 Tax=Nicotiana tomentosiformis TaxID=4098 RepID=UPI00388CCCCE
MIMRVDNEEAVFNVYRSIQLPRHYEDLAMISVVEINEAVMEPSAFKEDTLENALMLFTHLELEEEVEEIFQILDASCEYIRERSQFEPLDRPIGPPPKPLEEKILKVLREHKRSIGLTMSNIKGISPEFFMHKILMEEGHKPSVEHQRRLNPNMKEVVKKEVIKWLNTCIDYRKLNNTTRKVHFPLPFIDQMLERFEETNLELNWKKCHFMVCEGIVLGNKVSKDGLEVDKAKVEAIEKLPQPISVKGVQSFLGHAGFYRRFIKDFSKISSHLCRLLEKDVPFKFDDACLKALDQLKKKLVSVPIIVAPNSNEPFELMCDTSDGAIGAVLGQRRSKIFYSIYYEFDLEIRDRKGTENQVADHLSPLETRNHVAEGDVIKETFPDEQLMAVTAEEVPWYANFVNYLASGEMPPDLEPYAKKEVLARYEIICVG